MNIEQLSTMTDSELRVRANAHLEHLDSETESDMTKEHHVAQAQIYLTELDRREQAQERVKAAKIAKVAYESGKTIRQVALETSGLDKAKLEQLLDARSQTEPGTGAGGSAGG